MHSWRHRSLYECDPHSLLWILPGVWTPTLSPHHSQAGPSTAAPQAACLMLTLYPWSSGRKEKGAQLVPPVRGTTFLTICARSLHHRWERCHRPTTAPVARSGKQGPSRAISRGQCCRVEWKEVATQTHAVFGEGFLSPSSWVLLQGRRERSVCPAEASPR